MSNLSDRLLSSRLAERGKSYTVTAPTSKSSSQSNGVLSSRLAERDTGYIVTAPQSKETKAAVQSMTGNLSKMTPAQTLQRAADVTTGGTQSKIAGTQVGALTDSLYKKASFGTMGTGMRLGDSNVEKAILQKKIQPLADAMREALPQKETSAGTLQQIQKVTTGDALSKISGLDNSKLMGITADIAKSKVNDLQVQIDQLEQEKAEKTGNRLQTGLTVAQSQVLANEYNEKINALKAEQAKMGSVYYLNENQGTMTKLKADAEQAQNYRTAREAEKDLEKVAYVIDAFNADQAAVSSSVDSDKLRQYKADLKEKYGLDDSAFNYFAPQKVGSLTLSDLQGQLENQIEELTGKLAESDFDYSRLSGYEDMLKSKWEYEQEQQRLAALAEKYPVSSSLLSVAVAPIQGADYLRLALGNIGHNSAGNVESYVPLNVYEMDATNLVSTVRQTVGQKIADSVESELVGNVAKFFYDTGMSIADSTVQVALFGTWSCYLMGLSAASNTAKEVIERGGTNQQVLLSGLAAGAAEALFEKVSIENLLANKNITSVKSWLKETAKQGGVEASEEAFTEIANILTDAAIMGDKSNFKTAIEAYKAQGMTEEKAKQVVYLDLVKQVAAAAAGGLVSGLAMGGVTNAVRGANDVKVMDNMITMVDAGLHMEEGSEGRVLAEELVAQLAKAERETDFSVIDGEKLNKLGDIVMERYTAVQAAAKAVERTQTETHVNPAQDAAVTALTEQAAATQAANAEASVLDAATTMFVQQGMSKKTAETRAKIIQRLIDGDETVTVREINKLDPTSKVSQRTFTQLTGVQFPDGSQGIVTTKQLQELYRSAHTVAQAAQTAAEASEVARAVETVQNAVQAANQAYYGQTENAPVVQSGQSVSATDGNVAQNSQAVVENQISGDYTGTNNVTEVETHGGEEGQNVSVRGSGQRYDGQNPGGSVRNLAQEAGRDQGRQETGNRPRDAETSVLTYGDQVSAAEIGLQGGSNNRTVRLVKKGQTVAMKKAKTLAKKHGLDVTFFSGNLEMQNGDLVRGCISGDRIYIRVDHSQFTASQIAQHEVGHQQIAAGEIDVDAVVERLHQTYSDEQLKQFADQYLAAYADSSMTLEEVWEEIICDALGGMNVFAGQVNESDWSGVLTSTYQAAATFDPDVRQALNSGKRIDIRSLSIQDRTALTHAQDNLAVDAQNRLYKVDPEQHISRRTHATVGNVKVNAFQFDHPELHQYIAKAAESLIGDANSSLESGTHRKTERTMQGKQTRQTIETTHLLDMAMAHGLSRNEIITAAQQLIESGGQENNAAAKRVELALDEWLTEGDYDMDGYIPPNEDYIKARNEIPGYLEKERNELPLSRETRFSKEMNKNGREEATVDIRGVHGENVRSEAQRIDTGRKAASQEADRGNSPQRSTAEWARGHATEESLNQAANTAKNQAQQYAPNVYIIDDATLKARRGASWGVTSDGVVYISDALPAELADVVGYHEAVHAAKQNGDASYQSFLGSVGEQFAPNSGRIDAVFDVILQSKYEGKTLFDLSPQELSQAYDELNAVIWGFHKADAENARAQFSEMFRDYDAYISGLDSVMEGIRAGQSMAMQAEENTPGYDSENFGQEMSENGREGQKWPAEARSEFLLRAAGENKEHTEGRRSSVSFRVSGLLNAEQTNAGAVQRELTALGIKSYLYSGGLEVNNNGQTMMDDAGAAATIDREFVMVRDDVTRNPIHTAGHEALHVWGNTDSATAFKDAVYDNVRFGPEYIALASEIETQYFPDGIDTSDIRQQNLFREEMAAEIAGMLHSGEDVSGLLSDPDAAKQAWQDLVREKAPGYQSENFGQEMRENGREGQERRTETRDAFLRRAAGEGYGIFEGAAAAYGYRSVRDAAAGLAGQVQKELTKLGIRSDVVDGDVLSNKNGVTQRNRVLEASTASSEHIFISKDTTLPPRRTAGHEVFHLWKNEANRAAYIEVIEDNLLFNSEEFRLYQSVIVDGYFGGEIDLADGVRMSKLREELFAYISGDIHEGANDAYLRPMFRDFDAVKQAWQELVQKNAPGYQFDTDREGVSAAGEDALSNTRFSRETDRKYQDAVESGNILEAQRMVDKAAKEAGYVQAVFHGTDGRFNRFDRNIAKQKAAEHRWLATYPAGTIFLANKRTTASGYGSNTMDLYLDTSGMKTFKHKDMYAADAMDELHTKDISKYPVIAVEGSDATIYATLSGTRVKRTDAAIYDDNGNLIPLSRRFNKGNPDVRYSRETDYSRERGSVEYAPTFYSKMEQVIDEMKLARVGAENGVNYLKGRGVKDEEIKWSGIAEFLKGKKSVSKEELLEFVRGNQLEIEEVVKSGSDYEYNDEQLERLEELDDEADPLWDEAYDLWRQVFDADIPAEFMTSDNKADYLARKMNNSDLWRKDGAHELYDIAKQLELNDYWRSVVESEAKGNGSSARWGEYSLLGGENYREYLFKMPGSDYANDAMEAHWGDNAAGVLAHARVQDFTHDDQPVLFIEEIQSDWHNQGAREGYRSDDAAQRLSEMDNLRRTVKNAVPDAPYSKTYHEFVLKNLLRKAAEGSYSYLAWTPGTMQEARWSSEYAEGYRIEYDQDIPKFLNKYGKQWGAQTQDISLDGTYGEVVHAIPITEEMKQSVLYKGQPRFSREQSGQNKNASTGETGKYTAEEAAKIRYEGRTFKNIIVGIDSTVTEFFSKWSSGRKSHLNEKLEKLYLGKMSDSVKQETSNILGYDVTERNFVVTNDDVKHIMDEHGDAEAEIKKGNLPLDSWALEALPDVVTEPDSVTAGHEGSGKNSGKIGVVFEKTLSDGRIVCVQFDNKGRGTMEVTTVYVKESTPSVESAQQRADTRTPKATKARVLSDTSIRSAAQGVNPQFAQDSTNKTRFSREAPVERVGSLVAQHNMTEEKLRKTLELGAWPSPSIAITKATQGHADYGEYSVVFPGSTIDPQTDSRNRVYGSDAWTPTHRNAQVEYEVNYDAQRAFENKIEELSGQFAGGVFQNGSVIGSTGVNSETGYDLDEIARRLARYPAVQAAYLQSQGETLEPVYREKTFDRHGNEALKSYIDQVGAQELARMNIDLALGNQLSEADMETIKDVIIDDWTARNEWRLNQKPELREKRIANQRAKLENWALEAFVRHAWEYYEDGGATKSEIDAGATGEAMLNMILPDGSWSEKEQVVQDWVRSQLDGVLGEPGIYNGLDRITDEGRRSFQETHYPVSAENIVRAMYEQGQSRGEGLLGLNAEGMVSVATPEYNSVEEIRADEARLGEVPESEFNSAMRRIDAEIVSFTRNVSESLESADSDGISRALLEAAGSKNTQEVRRKFRNAGYYLTTEQAQQAMGVYELAKQTPTKYFEAKPERVVGFDEALAVLAPSDAPADLVADMKNAGLNVVEYERGNNADLLAKLNSMPEAMFSRENLQGEELAAAMEEWRRKWDQLQAQTKPGNFHEEGANAARETNVPKTDLDGKPVSKSASTVMGAKAVPEDVVTRIQGMVADGSLSYGYKSDKEAIKQAKWTISTYGFDAAMDRFRTAVNKGTLSKYVAVLGQTLLNNAANNHDSNAVAELMCLYQTMNTTAGQTLQAMSIFQKLQPESQLYGIQRMVDNLNEETMKRKKKTIADLQNGYGIEIDQKLIDKFLEQTDQAGRDLVMDEIYQNIADQVPSTWIDKWNAWRYLAMLGNARTHVRNVTGNLLFQPVVVAKDVLATAMETAAYHLGGKKRGMERTKAFTLDPELYKAAWSDFANTKDSLEGNKYNDARGEIMDRRKIFKFKPLEAVRKFNSNALSVEDAVFKRMTYTYSMAGYLRANGVTGKNLSDIDPQLLSKARDYAGQEALKATYNDTNGLSDAVGRLSRLSKSEKAVVRAAGVAVEGVLPFKKTPANILMRSLEYSPVGLAKGLTYDLVKVAQGEKTAAQAMDDISSGLTGSGLFVLGMVLAAMGRVTAGLGDDKDDKWAKLTGHQGYSLELDNGLSVPLDWLAPEAIPFFMGVELMNAVGENGFQLDDLWTAVKSMANPMLEMSMLQSLNDLLDTVSYSTSKIGDISLSALISYLSQAVPTIGGQIERTGENVRTSTYTDKTNVLIPTDVQYAIGKASAKIPGVDYQQIPYIDEWGRTESTGEWYERALNNFLSPAYTSQIEVDEVEEELQRLRESLSDTGMYPSSAARYLEVDNERIDLSKESFVTYATMLGQTRYSLLADGMELNVYKNMTDAERGEYVKKVYTFANAVAKMKVSDYQTDEKWIHTAMNAQEELGVSTSEFLTLYVAASNKEGFKDANGESVDNSKPLQVAVLVYDCGYDEETSKKLLDALGVNKSVRKWNEALIRRKLELLEERYG